MKSCCHFIKATITRGWVGGILLLVIFWANGCVAKTVEPPVTVSPVFISPVQAASFALPGEYHLPTPPSSDEGVVGGIILREIAGQPLQALRGGFLLLSAAQMEQDQAIMAIVEEDIDPRATADERGVFMFTEVPSGTYVLVYRTPAGVFVLREPSSGKDLLIEVKGGDVIDLGELRYDLPY